MSDVVIKVENVSKQYRLGEFGTGTLSHDLNRWWHQVRGKEDPYLKIGAVNNRAAVDDEEYVWALQDINLEVKQGEVLGIIGRNGAGKSTLLKLLSRVTSPTTGKIMAKGRVASLLEVGTGFHPELTGKENIYLNGAILGMTKAEVRRKLEEIVEFAGVTRYLDTPVKRYSSGMKVRLGFAVAAHLDPEILIVDEVLAVGDAEFQRKAIGKIEGISKGEKRTILFVSHNMVSIQNLCKKTILLEDGKISLSGNSNDVISHYLTSSHKKIAHVKDLDLFRDNGYHKLIKSINFRNKEGELTDVFYCGSKFLIDIIICTNKTLFDPVFGIGIDTSDGKRIIFLQSRIQEGKLHPINGEKIIRCEVPSMPLTPGKYIFSFGVSSQNTQIDRIENALSINILENDYFGTGYLPQLGQGPILVKAKWTINEIKENER